MSKHGRSVGLAGLAALMLFASSGMAQSPAVRPLITSQIDEDTLVTLSGNTRPEATAENDRGRLDDATRIEHMFLLLQRAPEREQALVTMIDQLHDRKSANFHHWLTPEQFGTNYGLGDDDIKVIKSWMESHGFVVNQVYPNDMMMDFSGTAGQIRESLHTEIHQLLVNGVKHIANMSDPKIPAALAPAVKGVVSLNDFRPRAMLKHVKQGAGARAKAGAGAPTDAGVKFTFGPSCGFLTGLRDASTNCEALMPQDVQTIYNITPLLTGGITGKGQTVVVIEDEDAYSLGDWILPQSGGAITGLSLRYRHPDSSRPSHGSQQLHGSRRP